MKTKRPKQTDAQKLRAARKELKALRARAAHDAQREKAETGKHAELMKIGKCAYSALAEMVAALECDYDRLEELRDERKDWLKANPGSFIEPNDPRDGARWAMAFPDESDELSDLAGDAGDCTDRDDAEQRVHEDALSVDVRSDWHEPTSGDYRAPSEFQILLATGGPAVRIMGELDEHGEPYRAWLEVQDWFRPWTRYPEADSDVLLAYARCFHFGEG